MDVLEWHAISQRFRGMIEQDYVVVQRNVGGTPATEWRKYDVSALIKENTLVVGDGYRAKNVELSGIGLPFARAGNVTNGFQFSGADCFPVDEIHKVGEKISRPGDCVFTSKGTVGKLAFVRSDTPRFVYSPQLSYWRSVNTKKVDPRFLYYWMASREFSSQFRSVAGQTDMAEYVSLRDQRRMYITLPPLPEQRAIAGVLGALDDKIELNRRINETLEQMARALFKSWFVDFDPVHAKMAGRWRAGQSLPGLPAHLYYLFPSRLVASEVGAIPEGWRVGTLNDIIHLLSGGTPRTSVASYWDGDIPWYTAKDAPSLSDVFVLETERTVSRAGIENSAASVLPVATTTITARGTVGRLACLGVPMAMNQTCYGIRGAHGYPELFTYWNIRTAVDDLLMRTHGTIFDTITRQTFTLIEMPIAPVGLTKAFEAEIKPVMARILSNLKESHALRIQRDALLPALLSGKALINRK